jgi:hypothetical protein
MSGGTNTRPRVDLSSTSCVQCLELVAVGLLQPPGSSTTVHVESRTTGPREDQ